MRDERESEKKKRAERRERDSTISRPYVDGLGAGMPGSYFSTCIPRPPDDIFTFEKGKIEEGENERKRKKKVKI